ncbi:MAG: hypothetical protein VKK59_01340 [Vampirovibrionales bacterium]|nr:hypothetical protein [Vampirovibrionales bacterium]
MTPEQLNDLLAGSPLLSVLDVKSLVLDYLKTQPSEALLTLFETFLPELDADIVAGYRYMSRK